MLLPSSRFLEGLLAIYSFLHYMKEPCRVRIHSDGTLTAKHQDKLAAIVPGAEVVMRPEADTAVRDYLNGRALSNCLRLREGHVFGLKVIDMCVLSRARRLVLLDCDVLFYANPIELLTPSAPYVHCYQRDYRRSYCLSNETFAAIEGANTVLQLNPGIMSLHMPDISLYFAERALEKPGFFLPNGKPDTFAELTLWAALVSQSPNCELPETYNFCSGPWLGREFVAGHFAGYGYWPSTYYTKGVPYCLGQLSRKHV